MAQVLRDEYLSQRVQGHLSNIILNTLNALAFVGYKNLNLDREQYDCLKSDLNDAKNSDITVIARLFRNRYSFTDSRNMLRTKTILSLGRNIKDNHETFLKNNENQRSDNIKKLYNILRELDPLVQNLVYYRNFCSHNMKAINQSGWELAIIAGVIRTCEISLNDKSTYQLNSEIIESFKLFAQASSGLAVPPSTSSSVDNGVDVGSTEETSSNLKYSEIDLSPVSKKLDEIISSIDDLTNVEKKLDELILLQQQSQSSSAQEIHANTNVRLEQNIEQIEDESSIEGDDAGDISYDDVNTITPEILRQRLQEISVEIKNKYKSAPRFGARTNLLQVANIGIILQREPTSVDEMIAYEEIGSRVDLESPLIMEQISDYGEIITDLLSNVLWGSAFAID